MLPMKISIGIKHPEASKHSQNISATFPNYRRNFTTEYTEDTEFKKIELLRALRDLRGEK